MRNSWKKICLALAWLLAFVIPWGDMVVLPYDIQMSRAITVVTALAWLFYLRSQPALRPLAASHWLLLAFVVWAAANVIWVAEPERALRRALSYCQLFVNAWVIYQSAGEDKMYRRLLLALLGGCAVAFSGLAYNFANGIYQGDGRYTAPGFDPNDLAATLILAVPMGLNFAFHSSRLAWVGWLYVPCAVLAGLLTASRSALAVLAVCFVLPFVAASKVKLRALVTVMILTAACGWLLSLFWNDVSFRRLNTFAEQLSGRDLNGRVEIWERGFDAFLENPLVGVGGGGFGTSIGARNREIAAHNVALGVLVEHGLVGLSLLCGAFVALFVRNWRRRGIDSRLWAVVLLGWMITATTLSWENREMTWLLWGLCSGAAMPRPVARGARRQESVSYSLRSSGMGYA